AGRCRRWCSAGARSRRARRPPTSRATPTRRTATDGSCRSSSGSQDEGGAAVGHAQRAAGAVDAGQLGALHLAIAALAAQVLGGLDDEEDAAHARMVGRQAATVEVDRQLAAETDAAAADERATLTDLAEAQIL